jgi:hypothetical protein
MSEPRLKTERLYREGKIAEALNAFVEAEIDLERDGGSVVKSKGLAKMTETGEQQMRRYAPSCTVGWINDYRAGRKTSPYVRLVIDELLEAYQAGGTAAILTLRAWQYDEIQRQHTAQIEKLKPRPTLNELRALRAA